MIGVGSYRYLNGVQHGAIVSSLCRKERGHQGGKIWLIFKSNGEKCVGNTGAYSRPKPPYLFTMALS